ncbi:MAG: Urease accessory protein UreF, partial [uncultured Quadrisphaera sp.]
MTLAALLALADSRLPAGGHAHSGAGEQLVTDRLVRDEASLATLLRRRLLTGGAVAAGLAAAACAAPKAEALLRLDDEA